MSRPSRLHEAAWHALVSHPKRETEDSSAGVLEHVARSIHAGGPLFENLQAARNWCEGTLAALERERHVPAALMGARVQRGHWVVRPGGGDLGGAGADFVDDEPVVCYVAVWDPLRGVWVWKWSGAGSDPLFVEALS